MSLNDRQHVEAVALMRRLRESVGLIDYPDEVVDAAEHWLNENHPKPEVYIAAIDPDPKVRPSADLALTATAREALAAYKNMQEIADELDMLPARVRRKLARSSRPRYTLDPDIIRNDSERLMDVLSVYNLLRVAATPRSTTT